MTGFLMDNRRLGYADDLGKLGRVEEETEILLDLARDQGTPDEVRIEAYESLKRLLCGGMR